MSQPDTIERIFDFVHGLAGLTIQLRNPALQRAGQLIQPRHPSKQAYTLIAQQWIVWRSLDPAMWLSRLHI